MEVGFPEHGGWNCLPQTQGATMPKSLPYLQPRHELCLPEKPCPRHTLNWNNSREPTG